MLPTSRIRQSLFFTPLHRNQSHGDLVSPVEEKAFRDYFMKKRLRRLNLCKGSIEIIMGAFAVYNTVRYFLAFTMFESVDGQAASLSLGISTGASFAFLVCAFILSLFQPYLLSQHIPLRFLLRTRTAFHAAASLALFGPAVANVVLLFIWKASPNMEVNVERRCHVDIDVVWSVSDSKCPPHAWGMWIALSFLRLVITLFVMIVYHWIATTSHRLRRPSLSRSQRKYHDRAESFQSALSPATAGVILSPIIASSPNQLHSQPSESTLRSNTHSKHSSSTYHPSHTAAGSSAFTDEDETLDNSHLGHFSHMNIENTDVELDSFHPRFRSLVSQINRETEEGLELAVELARSDASGSPPQTYDALPPDYDIPRVPPAVGYDEFGRPYPPDERVSILNGYVRRMPTIESMGSREVGSMTASSVYTDRDTMTTSMRSAPISRPPTRANTLSAASEHSLGSSMPSRTNSIAAGAEILLSAHKTSEVGELLHVQRDAGRPKDESSLSSGSSYPSTMSYYTATSFGSAASGGNPPTPPPGTRH
ncbi:hypothetical protein DXG03_006846 [Asterophora parasitica]|uniref:Uncharacterized protein n=1 Tax=Asterophora parasitica TaxID=117018 RepID=A0A9P7G774_9AGAR|nr:hypothetical protein DXG03_006846 [Asterophora parasitica]